MKNDYSLHPPTECPVHSISEVAEDLNIHVQRASRLLKILEIPIHKKGKMVFLDAQGRQRLREALQNREVRRGRKSNG